MKCILIVLLNLYDWVHRTSYLYKVTAFGCLKTLVVHESLMHYDPTKTRLPKNFFSKCIYSEMPAALLFLQVSKKTGYTLSTHITAIVCWRLILSATSALQPGHPAWMCLWHVILLCGLQQKKCLETQGSTAMPMQREMSKICHLQNKAVDTWNCVKEIIWDTVFLT